MLGYKLVENKKYNKVFREYYMTQGDTFQNQLNFTYNGKVATPEIVEKITFKLFNIETNGIEYEQDYEYLEEIGKWAINIDTNITTNWEITSHMYEYEVTYGSGDVRTLAQAKFVVTIQGQELGG